MTWVGSTPRCCLYRNRVARNTRQRQSLALLKRRRYRRERLELGRRRARESVRGISRNQGGWAGHHRALRAETMRRRASEISGASPRRSFLAPRQMESSTVLVRLREAPGCPGIPDILKVPQRFERVRAEEHR